MAPRRGQVARKVARGRPANVEQQADKAKGKSPSFNLKIARHGGGGDYSAEG